MRFCVLGGAGHIGSKAVRELIKRDPDAEVIIADKNLEKAESIAEESDGNVSARSVDANESKSLNEVMKGVDVAISTLGPFHKYGKRVLRAAIEARTDFVDIDDDYDATSDCLDLHDEAKDAGIVAIIGLGATPGLTNIWAKYGAEKLDGVDEIHTSWAWTAVDPEMGPAIVDHYFHAITGKVPTYRDGKWMEVPALSDPEIVEFPPPLGRFEPSNVGHPEPVTIPRYIEGVRTVTNKGTVWPSSMNEAGALLAQMGLTSQKEITISGMTVPVRDVAVEATLALEELAPQETIEEALEEIGGYGDYALRGVGLKTTVKGEVDGERTQHEYASSCIDARAATAIPAVLGSLMVAREEIDERGAFAPEGIIDPEALLREISKDIEIVEIEEKVLKLQ